MKVPAEIVKIVDELDPPIRARRLTNEDALSAINCVLRTGISWRDVQHIMHTCSASAVYKRYRSWIASGLLERVWKKLLLRYSEKRIEADARWFHDIFIDTSMIKNVGGVDGMGRNPTDRGRMATKLSAIVDRDGIPVSVEFFAANRSDVTTALESFNAIACPLQPCGLFGPDRRFKRTLVGDKGYVSQELQNAVQPFGARLLTPRKKNSKIKNKLHYDDRRRLKRRHVVENLFCRLDKFKKIHCRHEKTLLAYKSFTLLACIMLFASPKIRDVMDWTPFKSG